MDEEDGKMRKMNTQVPVEWLWYHLIRPRLGKDHSIGLKGYELAKRENWWIEWWHKRGGESLDTTELRLLLDMTHKSNKGRNGGLKGRTADAEGCWYSRSQFVAGCDAPVQQRSSLDPLLDITHKSNGKEVLLGANHTKKREVRIHLKVPKIIT